ncbi:MAG: hypothetical protein LBC78_04280, partial [Oscillospiraceae bacterium]|nr:hypothetical protein [Oscillospiraceae bacterium]
MRQPFVYSKTAYIPDRQLQRPRITKLLDAAMAHPLIAVTAGAGFGKSSAVYSFLQKQRRVVFWLQASMYDNLTVRFWEGLAQAVAARNPEYAAHILDSGFPNSERKLERFRALTQKYLLPGVKYVLVIDDFHLIHEEELLRFVYMLSVNPILNFSLILISREELKLSTAGLMLNGTIACITERDLCFDEDETRRYFQNMGFELSEAEVKQVLRNTGGWAFMISLLGYSLRNGTPHIKYALRAVQQNVYKLIDAEFFTDMPRELQNALIKCSLLEWVPIELLGVLIPESRRFKKIMQNSAFVRYDAYSSSLRIHPLFLEFLREKQDCLTDEDKQSTYAAAADWCHDHQNYVDAFIYFEKAGDYSGIARTAEGISLSGGSEFANSRATAKLLFEILERAGDNAFSKTPELIVLKMRVLQALGRFEDGKAYARAVIDELERGECDAEKYWLLSECYYYLGFYYIFTAILTSEHHLGTIFRKAYENYERSGRITRGYRVRCGVGAYINCVGAAALPGEFDWGNDQFAEYVRYAIDGKQGLMDGVLELARAEIAYYRADIKNAERFAAESYRLARRSEQFQVMTRALLFLLRIALHKGNPEKLKEYIKQLEEPLDHPEFYQGRILHEITLGWFFAHLGKTDMMAGWLKNNFESRDLISFFYGLEAIVKAKYQLAQGEEHLAIETI